MKIHIHYDLNAFMGIVANCFMADNNKILRSGEMIGLEALDKPIQFLSEMQAGCNDIRTAVKLHDILYLTLFYISL